MLTGQNGILTRAGDAKEKTEVAKIVERIKLAEMAAIANARGNLEYEKLKEELAKEFGIQGIDWDISDEEENPWVVTVSKIEYSITHNKAGTGIEGNVEVTVGESTINLKIGEEKTLTAIKNPNDDSIDVNWNTSNESVATIDTNGKITPMGVGTAIITASVVAPYVLSI